MINSISFGAKFIKKGQLQQYDRKTDTYKPAVVSIVEIDPKKEADIRTVCEAAKNWRGEKYASSIVGVLCSLYAGYLDKDEKQVYALTAQQDCFNNLESAKILGLAEVDHAKSPVKLDFLQVKPDSMFKVDKRNYKGVGSSILTFLKGLYGKGIMLQADRDSLRFYEKNGFKLIEKDRLNYIWHRRKV